MHEVSIRPVEGYDVPSIGAIYREAVAHGSASFELEPPDDEELAGRMAALVSGGFPYLVAVAAGTLLGYAYAGPYRSRPAYRFAVEDSVYLDAAARGRGVGRRLLDRLIVESERRGFRQMVAIIGDSANAASIALHRAAGFTHTGTLVSIGWKHGRWLDSVIMQRPIGAGDTGAPAE